MPEANKTAPILVKKKDKWSSVTYEFEPIELEPGDDWAWSEDCTELIFFRDGKEFARRKVREVEMK